MKGNHFLQKQNGLTLLEIILAFFILTFVVVSFIAFFPQASNFNNTTGEMLKGVHLAREKLVKVQSDAGIINFINNAKDEPFSLETFNKSNPEYETLKLSKDIEETTDQYVLTISEGDLISILKIYKAPDFAGFTELYRIHIEVQNNTGHKVSEVYGYITYG